MNMKWLARLTMACACLVLWSTALGAKPLPPSPDPYPSLVVGISAIEPAQDVQVDGLRNVEVWGFFYNATSRPVVLDWRTRRLRTLDRKKTALNSQDDYDGTLELHPNQVFLFHPTFYSREGRTEDYVFSIRDDAQRVYSVCTTPGATNVGPFSSLPVNVQRMLIGVLTEEANQRWWWRDY